MLRCAKEMKGGGLTAADGPIGPVRDLLFDPESWAIRCVVADADSAYSKPAFFRSPVMTGNPETNLRFFPARLAGEDNMNPRRLDSEAMELSGHATKSPPKSPARDEFRAHHERQGFLRPPSKAEMQALRSMDETVGYRVLALDGPLGYVEGFIVDVALWTVIYLAAGAPNWLPGKLILIPPELVQSISVAERTVHAAFKR